LTRQQVVTDRNGAQITYTYTTLGNVDTLSYQGQVRVKNWYDNLGRVYQVDDSLGSTSIGRDDEGRITTYTDAQGSPLGFLYNAAGNLSRITYPDLTKATYHYDALNRLEFVRNWLTEELYEQATYTCDDAGRLETFTNFNGLVTAYTYDDANRLTDIASPVAAYHLALDANGNRIAAEEPQAPIPQTGSTVYTFNAQKNRLQTAGTVSYTYDDEGQLASAGTATAIFDYTHRLIGIVDGELVDEFFYDAAGNRLRAVRDGAATRYVYDPWGNLLAETDELGQITRKYIYGNGLIALATPSARYCYHFNATGSTVAITDMNQAVVNAYAYEPFGEILSERETIAQPFKFVGQYGVMAEPNGLYYMRARYYDPVVGGLYPKTR